MHLSSTTAFIHSLPAGRRLRLTCPLLLILVVATEVITTSVSLSLSLTPRVTRKMLSRVAYPAVRRATTSYVKHGRTIPDPYHWLESPDADETKAYVTAQNSTFEQVLSGFPHRQDVLQAITNTQDYPRTGAPTSYGRHFYFYHNTGMQNQSVLMRTTSLQDTAEKPTVFLDPNTLSADGTSSLSATAWSESDTYFAYGVSDKGSDWSHIRVREAASGADLSDRVEWVKYSGISWFHDIGFFYTRYPALKEGADKGAEVDSALNAAVYFHKLGTSQSEDVRIFDQPEHPKWLVGAEVSDCHSYVLLSTMDGCEPKNLLAVAVLPPGFGVSLEATRLPIVKHLITEWKAEYNYLTNDGTRFYFITTLDAPLKRVVALDVAPHLLAPGVPESLAFDEIVAATDAKLDFCSAAKDTLLLVYLRDVKHDVVCRVLNAPASTPTLTVPLPIGSVVGFSGRRNSSFVSVKITSFLLPGRTFYFSVAENGGPTIAPSPHVFRDDTVAGLDPDAYETKQIFYEGGFAVNADGSRSATKERIPMFIFHKKGVQLDGHNPTLLYGYGGFNISVTPSFSASRLVFVRNLGGVVAVANIRGGGEYGERWHKAGSRATKQNCFDDFIAAARYLHAQKYSSPETLAIMGGSNGGLLVAACANQAPHLLRAVVAQVGVLDMFKFHQFTIGHAWKSDYGDPDVEADFELVEKYSPLHNIRTNVQYPAVLALSGDHDDRVVPLHTLKYVASMQHANPESALPCLARIEVAAGHGAGKPTSKIIAEAADIYSFISMAVGAKWTNGA